MELVDLGYDDYFQHKRAESDRPEHSVARVTAVNRDGFLVRNEHGEVLAELSGRFAFSTESSTDYPTVGDWALVQYYNADTLAIIDDLLPKRSLLRRKTAGKKIDYQMIAANIDVACIVQSCDSDFNLRRLERYLVMANDGHIAPMVLLSKSDLVTQIDLDDRISEARNTGIDCEVIAFSNETGSGLTQVRQAMKPGRTYCLLGSSGVGKTTLLNHLVGDGTFKTKTVRLKDRKGRHTTARRQLIVLEQGAMLIDTPGMRELGNIGVSSGIDESFSDIMHLSAVCRFNDCTHTSEADCSVLMAVSNGELGSGRYQSYLKLVKESEHHQMSYLEKRQKDKKFGQFIKSTLKEHKKRG